MCWHPLTRKLQQRKPMCDTNENQHVPSSGLPGMTCYALTPELRAAMISIAFEWGYRHEVMTDNQTLKVMIEALRRIDRACEISKSTNAPLRSANGKKMRMATGRLAAAKSSPSRMAGRKRTARSIAATVVDQFLCITNRSSAVSRRLHRTFSFSHG
jgi:hypothetical protein